MKIQAESFSYFNVSQNSLESHELIEEVTCMPSFGTHGINGNVVKNFSQINDFVIMHLITIL